VTAKTERTGGSVLAKGAEADPDRAVSRAVVAAKRGERDAIRYLYIRYADDVERYVRSIVRDGPDAEDVTQQVFAKLIRVIGKYEERTVPFSAWILRVARNAALDHLRSRRPIPCEEVRLDDEDRESGHEHARSLRDALGALPEEQRRILVLRHIVGLSPTEIADRLGRSEGSVHGLHHRGRRTLRRELRSMQAAPAVSRATAD
jgi:RNA polymerase sigma-70 factor (ECF subfamily)